MCGFFASNHPKVGLDDLPRIRHRIGFRGPDCHSDLVIRGNWKLFHARLSIIAPSEAYMQPCISESGAAIIFNGEILNFRALVKKYGLPETDSDTVALNALLDIETFDLNEIEGFFAFLRIDNFGNLTHCARDRFGVKPLFIHKEDGYMTVASEASIISDLFGLPYADAAMEEYHVFRAPVFAGSYFESISPVIPGTCIQNGTFFEPLDYFEAQYWDLARIMEELEPTISTSIESRLVSDVPVGLLYSGGIDSNLLDCLTNGALQRFSGGFAGDYDLEFARKRQATSSAGQTTLVEVSDSAFRERFQDMVRLRKEPLSVPNEVILSFLAEEWEKRGGKVLISGEAADEFFAGYDRIFRWAFQANSFDVNKFIDLYCYVPRERVSDHLVNTIEDFFDSVGHLSPFEMVRYFFVTKHLPVLFRRLDFALMFSGVEGREPLASYSMFQLAMHCSPSDLFSGLLGKLPLRLMAAEKIDRQFAFATKVGFPVDLGRIFRGMPAGNKFQNYNIWSEENMEALQW